MSDKTCCSDASGCATCSPTDVDALRAQVRTLEADNAALLVHLKEMVRQAGDGEVGDVPGPDMVAYMLAVEASDVAHPGAALLAKVDALLARVAELERAASLAGEAALEEMAQDFEMLTAGGHISGLEAADALRRRKSKPTRRFLDAEEEEAAAKVLRDAALEEAARHAETTGAPAAAVRIRALKSHPTRRLVDAERVEHAASVVRAVLDRATVELGLTDDDGTAAGSTSDLNAADIAYAYRALADVTSSTPRRRFVDAEEVLKVARECVTSAETYSRKYKKAGNIFNARGAQGEAVGIRRLCERLGLTLDGEGQR